MKKQALKKCLFLFIVVIAIITSFLLMIKYNVEGESELPFYLEKILIISTVDGKSEEKENVLWNINLRQNNDIYFYIKKKTESNEILKSITIENFEVTQDTEKGEIKILKPTGDLESLYTYSEENILESGVTFKGATIDDIKNLEISNQGGLVAIRILLDNLGTYTNNEDTEIKYDGGLLKKLNIKDEEIEFSIKFDIIIELESGIKYKASEEIDLPSKDLVSKGNSNYEINDFSNLVFKRINN